MLRNKEGQDKANEMFDKLRDEFLERDLSNTENYDKAILTLSSSSLALSLTVIKFIVPIAAAKYIIFLQVSWALLAISVICSLLAFLVSNKALKKQLDNAREYYKENNEAAFGQKNLYTTINSFLNIVTGLFFSIAISLLIAFIMINTTTGEVQMTKKVTGDLTTESTNIPRMERVSTTVTDNVGNSANIPTMEQVPTTSPSTQGTSSSSEKK